MRFTVAQFPHVLDFAQHTAGVELSDFTTEFDLHSDSFQSVQSGHHSQAASPTALGP